MSLDSDFNHARFKPGSRGGFYESYFQRGNHPSRPLAFWIRYTLFAPRGRPHDAIGELWAIWFDGERSRTVVAKAEFPAGQFEFARERLHARVGTALLEPGALRGAAESRGHRIEWELAYEGGQQALWLLPPTLYAGGFPKAKTLVGVPMARYRGQLRVDGEAHDISGWIGSQNHNWGARHTDRYAYGQVAGFDNAPGSFLEVATLQLKIGPLWTPRMTPLVLRHGGEEFALRSVTQSVLRARGRFGYFRWEFSSRQRGVKIEGEIHAPKERFVGLRYHNPPGGEKFCLNTKLAACRVTLGRAGRPAEVLHTQHRAAFEILTDDLDHGVEIRT